MKLVDSLNREIHLASVPKRIVSLVPSQTELLVDLGLEDAIVGITKFCVHPKNLIKNKKIVGGTKQVHLDKIKALQPDIILCNKEENTQDIVAACSEISPVHVSDIETISDCVAVIQQYGAMFQKEAAAKHISETIQNNLKDFQEYIKDKPRKKVAYFIWKKPFMVAGKHTFIEYLLKLNNFENVYADLDRYPEIDIANAKAVDTVFLSSEPYPFKEEHKREFLAYFPDARIQLVDGEMFSWYGSRLIKAFAYFKTLH
ncbi:ABC transporter substrate-binding protein [Oceanihabitans sediminis]|uniref:Cobalamin-binding protein n=1 Tax=Oceanihabitans sediminis TaxID=1812012 RepID=A0A368P1Z2_9FLAO|nr:helical backbone metal receptor [Oceanihabitans sediminis]MDX1278165.1 helical backbone metal receptor [Oceanihabitans sediminis]MDX1774048.1 helical backbone metal receptor [Oceanihabitans sediminis]RBP30911.1 substrate-binding family protein [Oceanihabitans sediminis]RCU56872.1 cobalamin-binding protein [Oceanihabitans sediminis]